MTKLNRPTRNKKRTPIGTRNVLKSENREGYVRRFVNNVDGRVDMFLDAGYSIVNDDTKTADDNVGSATKLGSNASRNVGGGTNAVLMEIPEEFYNEDQLAKEQKIKRSEESILADQSGNQNNSSLLYGQGVELSSDRPNVIIN